MVLARGWGKEAMGSYWLMDIEFQFYTHYVLWMDDGVGSITK